MSGQRPWPADPPLAGRPHGLARQWLPNDGARRRRRIHRTAVHVRRDGGPGPSIPRARRPPRQRQARPRPRADASSATSLGSSILSSVQTGADAVGQAVTTVSGLGSAGGDRNADRNPAYVGAVAGISGVLGRYSSGSRSTLQTPAATASSLLAAATAARTGGHSCDLRGIVAGERALVADATTTATLAAASALAAGLQAIGGGRAHRLWRPGRTQSACCCKWPSISPQR